MDHGIELRHLRYFVAVAEHGHFGRAAEALFIAQPSLSYTIRQLEQRVGSLLIDRSDRRHLVLTDAGETFLAHAREVLASVDVALAATRAVERGGRRELRVGYNDGEPLARRPGVLGAAVRAIDIDVTFRRLAWGVEGEAVRAGEVDLVLARLPIDARGLDVEIIHTEPRWICLPADHHLATARKLTLKRIRGVPIVRPVGGTSEWTDFWRGLPRPDGHVPPDGPVTYGPEDTFETVATGAAACFVPASMVPTVAGAGLRFIPVTDIAPVETAIVWSSRRRRPPGLDTFTAAARRLIETPT